MGSESATTMFRSSLRGQSFASGEPGYDEARVVFNRIIDRHPALIARCAGAADVMACVRFANEHGLTVSVRGGGHSIAGKAICDDGLMIDLSAMKGIRVDPASRTVRAEPGLTISEFDRETQAFGLATTMGVITTTGIAGLTLGGGMGWLIGKHGLACDNVIAMDVVTADGRLVTASDRENADLFWGMRGGGGNFGIVTSFEYRLHNVGPVLGGGVLYPVDKARDVLHFYRDFAATCPDELSTQIGRLTNSGRHSGHRRCRLPLRLARGGRKGSGAVTRIWRADRGSVRTDQLCPDAEHVRSMVSARAAGLLEGQLPP